MQKTGLRIGGSCALGRAQHLDKSPSMKCVLGLLSHRQTIQALRVR